MAQGTPVMDAQAPPPIPDPSAPVRQHDPTSWSYNLRRHWQLYTLLVLPLIFLFIFRYIPMAGNLIAFRRFRPGSSIFGDEWVGLHFIRMLIQDSGFWQAFTNTLILGVLTLVIVFPCRSRSR